MFHYQALIQSLITSPPPSLPDTSISWSDALPLLLDTLLGRDLDVAKAGTLLRVLPAQLATHVVSTTCATTRCPPLVDNASSDALGTTVTLLKLMFGYEVAAEDLDRVVPLLPAALVEHIKVYVCPKSWFVKQHTLIAIAAFVLGSAIFFSACHLIFKTTTRASTVSRVISPLPPSTLLDTENTANTASTAPTPIHTQTCAASTASTKLSTTTDKSLSIPRNISTTVSLLNNRSLMTIPLYYDIVAQIPAVDPITISPVSVLFPPRIALKSCKNVTIKSKKMNKTLLELAIPDLSFMSDFTALPTPQNPATATIASIVSTSATYISLRYIPAVASYIESAANAGGGEASPANLALALYNNVTTITASKLARSISLPKRAAEIAAFSLGTARRPIVADLMPYLVEGWLYTFKTSRSVSVNMPPIYATVTRETTWYFFMPEIRFARVHEFWVYLLYTEKVYTLAIRQGPHRVGGAAALRLLMAPPTDFSTPTSPVTFMAPAEPTKHLAEMNSPVLSAYTLHPSPPFGGRLVAYKTRTAVSPLVALMGTFFSHHRVHVDYDYTHAIPRRLVEKAAVAVSLVVFGPDRPSTLPSESLAVANIISCTESSIPTQIVDTTEASLVTEIAEESPHSITYTTDQSSIQVRQSVMEPIPLPAPIASAALESGIISPKAPESGRVTIDCRSEDNLSPSSPNPKVVVEANSGPAISEIGTPEPVRAAKLASLISWRAESTRDKVDDLALSVQALALSASKARPSPTQRRTSLPSNSSPHTRTKKIDLRLNDTPDWATRAAAKSADVSTPSGHQSIPENSHAPLVLKTSEATFNWADDVEAAERESSISNAPAPKDVFPCSRVRSNVSKGTRVDWAAESAAVSSSKPTAYASMQGSSLALEPVISRVNAPLRRGARYDHAVPSGIMHSDEPQEVRRARHSKMPRWVKGVSVLELSRETPHAAAGMLSEFQRKQKARARVAGRTL